MNEKMKMFLLFQISFTEDLCDFSNAELLDCQAASKKGIQDFCHTFHRQNTPNEKLICGIELKSGQLSDWWYPVVDNNGGCAHPYGKNGGKIRNAHPGWTEQRWKDEIVNFLDRKNLLSDLPRQELNNTQEKTDAPKGNSGMGKVHSGSIFERIQENELKFIHAMSKALRLSDTDDPEKINETVQKWETENHDLFSALFNDSKDLEKIDTWNKKCSNLKYAVQKFGLFELSIGNLEKAKIIILNNNPGADFVEGQNFDPQKAVDYLAANLSAVKRDKNDSQDHYYPFDRAFIEKISDYFPKKLFRRKRKKQGIFQSVLKQGFCRKSISAEDYQVLLKIAPYVVSLERFGYHSGLFGRSDNNIIENFPEQRSKVKKILENFCERDESKRPIIILARGIDKWKDLMGEGFFSKYPAEKIFYSTGQCGGTFTNNSLGFYKDINEIKQLQKQIRKADDCSKEKKITVLKESAWNTIITAWNKLIEQDCGINDDDKEKLKLRP